MNGLVSVLLFALRGLIAGSVTATTEMRIAVLRLLDDIARRFPYAP